MFMTSLDTRVPAVLLRIDPNPFHHGTLGAVRTLGRAGVEVHMVADSVGTPHARSRYVSGTHAPPAPGASVAKIAAVLRQVAARIGRRSVLVPMDDASAIAVSRLGADLKDDYLLPDQPVGLAERVADKAELATVCGRLGIPHPMTLVPGSADQAAAFARQLGLPVVAKWSRPWRLPPGSGLRSTVVLRSPEEAQALFRRTDEADSRLLLQAYLPPAPGRDWFAHGYVDRNGAVRGGGSGRKQRAWPRGAGLTTVGSWVPNPEVQALGERLVSTLGFRGIFDLDFRLDGTTNAYHLLDFNPRPGAQFRLFADTAGVDVVRSLHLDLTHRPVVAGDPQPGRDFVVENYAPLTALRLRRRRELAWYAGDDLAPGFALWGLWCRHAARRLSARRPAPQVRIVRQAGAPPSLPSPTSPTSWAD
jgi:predicted ATP-grasp superfamily ATP-dependent carboligase